jgi:hypoxanthine phosphoribosyltransferase
MKIVKLHDKQFQLYINNETINNKIEDLVNVLNINYVDKKPIFLCVLNGSFLFASELIKRFEHECEVSFVKLSSYKGINSTGEIKKLVGINDDLKGRNIIIVEDIVDTGNTIFSVIDEIKNYNPESVEVATLLFKPAAYQKQTTINYAAIIVGNEFLVGFGLDYNGIGRNLEDIYIIEEKS